MESAQSVNNYNNNVKVEASDNDDNIFVDPSGYYRNLSLSYFVAAPKRMLTEHERLKERCLENGNTEAHYIEGVLQFFVQKDIQIGLIHLRKAATGNNPTGMYLYGLLMLAEGHTHSGKKYLDKLKWKKERRVSDNCWERIKNSLSEIPVPMKQRYFNNMVNLYPQSKCDPENLAKVCKKCYYFKRLTQFILFITNKE
ncbi:F-box protein At2g35280-like [Brassica napus]|uniref:F-box protein At2g35280-like n=1 Tax=Brassica napus TaxID=3708 RepID=UPI0006AA6917|nr:F-box protein At2g35280-like [Brassica napus]